MENPTGILTISASAAALGGWLIRELTKFLMRREEAREAAEQKRLDEAMAQAQKNAEMIQSILEGQVKNLDSQVRDLRESLMQSAQEKAKLASRVHHLENELEELRRNCDSCPIKKQA